MAPHYLPVGVPYLPVGVLYAPPGDPVPSFVYVPRVRSEAAITLMFTLELGVRYIGSSPSEPRGPK
jgi:hypothetical protein